MEFLIMLSGAFSLILGILHFFFPVHFMGSIRFNCFFGNWLRIIWVEGRAMGLAGIAYHTFSFWTDPVCFDLKISRERNICHCALL